MTLRLDLYLDYKPTRWGVETKLLVLNLVAFGGYYFLKDQSPGWLPFSPSVLVVGAYFLYIFGGLYIFFTTKEHTPGAVSVLSIGPDGVNWNDRSLPWSEVARFVIDTHHEAGKRLWYVNAFSQLADGFNAVTLKTIHGETLRGHYMLESSALKAAIPTALWEIILANDLPYELAKSMLQPENFAAHQELRRKMEEHKR